MIKQTKYMLYIQTSQEVLLPATIYTDIMKFLQSVVVLELVC